MQQQIFLKRYFSIPDFAILLLLATIIYGIVAIGREWQTNFHPVTSIDLSIRALPYYTLLSGIRGIGAYFLSLGFTLIVGYIAAKSRIAETIIIPLLDILQSIPVLGFLPGLSIGLVALFPYTNTGLELAAIIMIFTSQVWNMTLCYYSSLKSIPLDFREASTMMHLNRPHRLLHIELPFSAINLAWNSLLSMAGGWFFLIPCEAFTLGDKEYRLPGIGAYMFVAIAQGNRNAIIFAIIAMILLIIAIDFVIWRPILAWVQKFRLEQTSDITSVDPLMKIWLRESQILQWIKLNYSNFFKKNRNYQFIFIPFFQKLLHRTVIHLFIRSDHLYLSMIEKIHHPKTFGFLKIFSYSGILFCVSLGALKLFKILLQLPLSTGLQLLNATFWTALRVFIVLGISTLWAVPVGIWLGTSNKRIRIAQPIIQILASFPAPMVYPLVLGLLFACGICFQWGSLFLMLLGVQWYVLFNVLAGSLRISKELNDALQLMKASRLDRWKTLYLPSIFPSLVTGWITAAGGAWNASIVAEYVFYQGHILETNGLGALLNIATAHQDLTLFAASLTLMILVVFLLNRFLWSPLYELVQTRFKMD